MFADEQKWREILKQILFLNFAATMISFSLNVSADGLKSFTLDEFVASLIHSNCIGPPVWMVVFRLSPHWQKDWFFFRLFKVFSGILAATFAGIIVTRFILILLYYDLATLDFSIRLLIPSWERFLFAFSLALTFGFGLYFYEVLQTRLRQKELEEEKAKTLAAEARLASLESRIHPHFLFNSLNSISALMTENTALAEEMMENFSELLRYSLDSNARSLVALKHELEITEKYLALEKLRYDERLVYEIKCEKCYLQTKIPPLSLQTLVENSIKHVVSKTSETSSISVTVKESGADLEIEVADSGKGFAEKELKLNHGLDNLQKRLQTIFDSRAYLQIVGNGRVRLHLPK